MRLRLVLLLALASMLVGCRFGTPSDPNDPNQAGMLQPEVLRRSLKGASDALLERVRRGEITDSQFKQLIAEAANEILASVQVKLITPEKAWEYGEIYRTARRWKEAKQTLELAVKVAKGEDRRINDTLRLAHVEAEMGEVKQAITTARKVLDAAPNASAPILPAVLLEIVPAARGKGQDIELAQLLESAIACHERTVVDPATGPGRDFLAARLFHMRRGWALVAQLYMEAGNDEQALAAIRRSEKALEKYSAA